MHLCYIQIIAGLAVGMLGCFTAALHTEYKTVVDDVQSMPSASDSILDFHLNLSDTSSISKTSKLVEAEPPQLTINTFDWQVNRPQLHNFPPHLVSEAARGWMEMLQLSIAAL